MAYGLRRWLLVALLPVVAAAQPVPLVHAPELEVAAVLSGVHYRKRVTLSGDWNYILDSTREVLRTNTPRRMAVYEDQRFFASGKPPFFEYDFDSSPTLRVPGDWNSQRPELFWYDSLVWYRKTLPWKPDGESRQFLYFEAANHEAFVYLNGQRVGHHDGGYVPFALEVTGRLLAGDNSLVVAVDGRRRADGVPSPRSDWQNLTGLIRPVHLVTVPTTFIDTFDIGLDRDGRLRTVVQLRGQAAANADVQVSIPALNFRWRGQTDGAGRWESVREAPRRLERWGPGRPVLYDVEVRAGQDTARDRIGFRTVEARGDTLLVNGRPIFLRGVNLHEEAFGAVSRRYVDEAAARALLTTARDRLGANFLRLAHYPHGETMVRMADELGLLVMEEIPVWQRVEFSNARTRDIAKRQLAALLARDRSRASLIMVAVGNETPPEDPDRTPFMRELLAELRRQDPSRLATIAFNRPRIDGSRYVPADPLLDDVDIVGFNTYVGWYDSWQPDDVARKLTWCIPKGKPFVFLEFGADAQFGMHGLPSERYTEESQAALLAAQTSMMDRIEGLDGAAVWLLKDIQTPRRLHAAIQGGWNRKGLLSPEGGEKLGFRVMSDWFTRRASPRGALRPAAPPPSGDACLGE